MSKSFRFGIMINGHVLKSWQLLSIQRLIDSGHVLALVIENENIEVSESKSKKYFGRTGLYHLFNRFFLQDDMLKNIDCSEFLKDVNVIKATPILKGKYSQYFPEDDISNIKNQKLDFILRFGFNIIRGEILNSAKFGIWSFHHDDNEIIRGGPPGFWEIYNNQNINGILLQRLTDKLDAGIIIRKSYVSIIKHSYKTHLNELLRQGIDILQFAVQNLEKLNAGNWIPIEDINSRIYRFPTNTQMIWFIGKLTWNRIVFNFNDLFRHEKWNFGIIKQPINDFIESKALNLVTVFPKPKNNSFFADPFIAKKGDGVKVFFENFNYKKQKGIISSVDFSYVNNEFYSIEKILERPYHLAFPFYIDIENISYLIPESSISKKLNKYSLDSKFENIEDENILFNGDCIDSVIFNFENMEWLFFTRKSFGTNLNLFAYYRENSNMNWKSHLLNPIVSDSRKARMAGNIIFASGILYRPAQKNNIFYGESVIINKIVKLTPEEFVEEEYHSLNAAQISKYKAGIHTLSHCDGYIAIDFKKYSFVPSEFWRKLKLKVKS